MKDKYEEIRFEVICFMASDVITGSVGSGEGNVHGNGNEMPNP